MNARNEGLTGTASHPLPTGARRLNCARCGVAFSCNLHGPCWCGEETVRLPLPKPGATEFDDCLCRDCLEAVAAGHADMPK